MAKQAIDCWDFCGGWAPERWPMYAALNPVRDWHALSAAMKAIRASANHG